MRTGILGGTFDPPHLGHIGLAHAAIESLRLDEVMMLPVNRNPLKTRRLTHPKHRLEMVRLAIEKEPKLSVSDIEIGRGGASYAVETLQELTFVKPAEYWFVLGADALKTLSEWKQPVKLLKMCRIAAVQRGGESLDRVIAALPEYAVEYIDWIEMAPVEISSTEIRQRLKAGRAVTQWLNPNVLRYIEENKLYRS